MMKRKSNFVYRFAVILVIALCTGNAWAQKYISDIIVYSDALEDLDEYPFYGEYEKLDQKLNPVSYYLDKIYLAIKRTDNPQDAYTDIILVSSNADDYPRYPIEVDGRKYEIVSFTTHGGYGNLNYCVNHPTKNVFIYATKDKVYKSDTDCSIECVTSIEFDDDEDECTLANGWARSYDSVTQKFRDDVGNCNEGTSNNLYMKANKQTVYFHRDLQSKARIEPDCTNKGYKERNECNYCGKCVTPEGSTVPLSDYELQPLGHDYSASVDCVKCIDEENGKFLCTCSRDASHQEIRTYKMLCVRADDDYISVQIKYHDGDNPGLITDKERYPEIYCMSSLYPGDALTRFYPATDPNISGFVSIPKGGYFWLYGNNPNGFSKNEDWYFNIQIKGAATLFGSVTSLLNETGEPTDIPNDYCFYKLFEGNTGIVKAPRLPATKLKTACYASMFEDCTNLTVAPPILPALTLVKDCYTDMFKGCTSLTVAPELPATTLVDNCYTGMFQGCSNLVVAPKLPATTLTENCYAYMFEGCSSLAVAPELPATTLTTRCYAYMFQGCSSLAVAPKLPATTLTTRCYYRMFAGCSNLIEAPELPATTLADMCYSYMFNGCSKLKSLTLGATGVDSKFYMFHWLDGTASSGGGIVYVNDQMILNVDAGNAELYLPVNWRTNKLVFHPYEDPDTPGKYYGTFCDSDDEYTVKADTKLYTAEEINATSKEVKMHETGNDIIPAGEMVMTVGDTPNVILTLSDTGAAKDDGNLLKGSAIDITIPGNSYYFTRGQYGIGFYPFIGETIKPRMAYVTNAAMRGSKIFYPDFGENASQSTVGSINIATEEGSVRNSFCIAPGMNTKITLVDNGGLTLNDKHGTIGMLYGREAMVLDLGGSVGRVAVATKNVGVTADGYIDIHRQNSDPYKGTTYIFEEVNNYWTNTLTGGWHVPTVEELQLLTDKLDLDSRYICLKWDISDSKTLWIPGYIDSNGNRGGMYAGVKLGDDSYAGLEFIFTENGYSYKRAYEDGLGYWDDLECILRPFHCLKSNNKCLKIESDNGVARTYDINSGLKLSFTPNASPAAMKIVFNDNAPIETEHFIEGTDISFSDDGESLYMTVNGEQVTYALDDIKEITFFDGTPSVQLTANQDPDHAGNYYTTFYSGLEAYILPKGVKAYTAKMEDSGNETIVRMTAIEGDVLPQGEAVLLYTQNGSNITMTTTNEAGTKADVNQFKGVDMAKEQTGVNYMLSYGQNGLGFYKMNSSMLLSANKAFLPQSANNAKAMRMVFDDGTTGISIINDALRYDDNNIYSISGIRLNHLQKGINIVNGKKIIVK